MKIRNYLFTAVAVLILFSCGEKERKLPFLGFKDVSTRIENGKTIIDTIYHQIADFKFRDQDSVWITNETFADKIYIADFFFTTCPTICPAMKAQLLRVYEKYLDNDKVQILSHTIDPTHDSIPVLKEFAEKLDVKESKWHFVTGEKDSIYTIGEKSYLVRASEDQFEPGGFIHSGAFILIDDQRRIRGLYDGTRPADVDRLMRDTEVLLKEISQSLDE